MNIDIEIGLCNFKSYVRRNNFTEFLEHPLIQRFFQYPNFDIEEMRKSGI